MSRILMLHGPRDLRYEVHDVPATGPGDVRVRTVLGAISAGTEAAWYFGTDPQLDPGFRPGRVAEARFPRTLGYEKLARVEEVGSEVRGLSPGQRVVGYYGHAEEQVVPAERLIPVPDGVTDEQAVAYSLATVAVHGVRRSGMRVGDDVFVAGLGFVGLMTVAVARKAGANRLFASDPYPLRRELALRMGADEALDPAKGDLGETLRARFAGEPFDVAFETSSSFSALRDAMAPLRRGGRVCVVSQLKGRYPEHPVFGIEFHLGELEMVSADGRGDVDKLARWYFGAVLRGAFDGLDDLVTHRVAFGEIERGFAVMEESPESVVKILVDYEGA